uniref:Calcineurin-like phosphoesterase n=1 Tax=Candidatus Kentrum sp. FM TaxID=2126340 RepID=A0A450W4L1_9GAMM|nr:MAG: hypothetical protein BECKFM1743C_GA0114222_106581 [Candidatus Kentron sp. FM]VFJ72809.1 MAG: hypothetical protein BECKFM1743A_GA0114220_106681 [Candidatus Kentron sp. FM]VFK11948.1 MAG: hypothetical protein BECKFM1743B_GA0114221_102171 [Candidatus Kentron sp. FM]
MRDDTKYPRRFKNYSDAFFHPLTQGTYPLDYEAQGLAQPFPDDRVQFLAFNSCWQIDEFFPDRASLHPGAVARCLAEADRQLLGEGLTTGDVLRVAVWHHPVTGNQKIGNTAFTEQLRKAGVRLVLHGHVHEDRTDLVGYQQHRILHVAGAGSFGVWSAERPPAAPQLYNLMEVDRGLGSVKVHTRYKDNEEGAWQGRAIWPGPEKGTKRTYYRVGLV